MKELIAYIEKLEGESFERWKEPAVRGYKTACLSIKKRAESIQKRIDDSYPVTC